jgi:hypothetical protein
MILSLAAATTLAQANRSVYTPLAAKQCRTIRVETTGAGDYEGRCRGVVGYSLLLLEGDLRQNIIVVTPKGAKHSLDLWDVVSGGFSYVGPRAEWRMKKASRMNGGRRTNESPVALILRYNASEDPEHPNRKSSYLVVAKFTPNEICVTDKISPGPKANNDARTAADNATTKPCLKSVAPVDKNP